MRTARMFVLAVSLLTTAALTLTSLPAAAGPAPTAPYPAAASTQPFGTGVAPAALPGAGAAQLPGAPAPLDSGTLVQTGAELGGMVGTQPVDPNDLIISAEVPDVSADDLSAFLVQAEAERGDRQLSDLAKEYIDQHRASMPDYLDEWYDFDAQIVQTDTGYAAIIPADQAHGASWFDKVWQYSVAGIAGVLAGYVAAAGCWAALGVDPPAALFICKFTQAFVTTMVAQIVYAALSGQDFKDGSFWGRVFATSIIAGVGAGVYSQWIEPWAKAGGPEKAFKAIGNFLIEKGIAWGGKAKDAMVWTGNLAIRTGEYAWEAIQAAAARAGLTATAPATHDLRILPLGDSITYGVGSSTTSSYRGDLHAALTGAGHTVDFVGSHRSGSLSDADNEGHSGYLIDQIREKAQNAVPRYRPNVVMVHAGTNDMNNNHDPGGAPDRLGGLIDQVVADAPEATVIVANLVTSSLGATPSRIATFNDQVDDVVRARQDAGQKVLMVDMSAVTTADMPDGLHPNDAGYAKMATAFEDGIDRATIAGWISAPGDVDPGLCTEDQNSWAPIDRIATGTGHSVGEQIHLANIDADGRDDYLSVNPISGAVHAWTNDGGDTAGRAGWIDRGQVAVGIPHGSSERIDFADIDGDGRDDYLVVNRDSGSIRAWTHNGAETIATGVWVERGEVAIGTGHAAGEEIDFGDVDGDGRDDYLVVNPVSGSVRAWTHQGAETLATGVWYERGEIATGTGHGARERIDFADVDADGRDDYLVVNRDSGSVRAWTHERYMTFLTGVWVEQGQIASGVPLAENGTDVVELANLDGDGREDYLAVSTVTGAVRAWTHQGAGTLTTGAWDSRGQVASGTGTAEGEDIDFADLDGDGRDDYLVVNPVSGAVRAWTHTSPVGSGTVSWNERGQVASGVPLPDIDDDRVQFGDIDGDGRDDYLAVNSQTGAVRAWTHDGDRTLATGHWIERGQIAPGTGVYGRIDFADIDDDGRDDYLVIDHQTGAVRAWTHFGGTTITTQVWNDRGQIASGGVGSRVTFAQVDCDPRADYLTLSAQTGAAQAWLNRGGDTAAGPGWHPRGQIASGVGHPDHVRFADMDGDGRDDYLSVNPATGTVDAWLNRGGDPA